MYLRTYIRMDERTNGKTKTIPLGINDEGIKIQMPEIFAVTG